jgi:hypothetical protein
MMWCDVMYVQSDIMSVDMNTQFRKIDSAFFCKSLLWINILGCNQENSTKLFHKYL